MNYRLARDGHLLDVDVDALIRGDLEPSLREQVASHAAECIDCRRRADRGRDEYRVPLPARPTPETSTPPAQPAAPPMASRPGPQAAAAPAASLPPARAEAHPVAPAVAPPPPPEVPAAAASPINLDVAAVRRRNRRDAPKEPPQAGPARKAALKSDGPAVSWKRHLPTVMLVVGALALLVVAASGGDEEEAPTGPVLPTAFRLGVTRDRGGAPEVLLDSATAQLGDALSFTVALPETTPVVVVAVNANGEVTPVFPANGAEATPVQKGESTLPVTVTLSGNPGMDRYVALACARGMSVADASVLAMGVPESGKVPPMFPGCQESVVRLRKLL